MHLSSAHEGYELALGCSSIMSSFKESLGFRKKTAGLPWPLWREDGSPLKADVFEETFLRVN